MTPLLLEKALTAPDGGRSSAAGMDAELLTSTRNERLSPLHDTAFVGQIATNMEGKGVTGLTRYSQ